MVSTMSLWMSRSVKKVPLWIKQVVRVVVTKTTNRRLRGIITHLKRRKSSKICQTLMKGLGLLVSIGERNPRTQIILRTKIWLEGQDCSTILPRKTRSKEALEKLSLPVTMSRPSSKLRIESLQIKNKMKRPSRCYSIVWMVTTKMTGRKIARSPLQESKSLNRSRPL